MYDRCTYKNSLYLIALVFSINVSALQKKLAYLKPPTGLEHEGLFNLNKPNYGPDKRLKPIFDLKKALITRGYDVRIVNYQSKLTRADVFIAFNGPPPPEVGQKLRSLARKSVLIITEPPSVLPQIYNPRCLRYFTSALVMDDKLASTRNCRKFHYPIPNLTQTSKKIPFEQKKFCILLASNKTSTHPQEIYSQRKKTITFFETKHPSQLSLYGTGWERLGLKTYKGTVSNKSNVMPYYKFCICYENIRSMHGYVTEKIFDCLVNRCLPVYWGAPNITRYVPSTCFIDRRKFASNQSLYDYLKNMPKDRYEFHQKEISKFLASAQAQKFLAENFVKIVLECLS